MKTYNNLGIRKIINAAGTYTKYSGSLISPEVIEAMKKASKSFVDVNKLLEETGKYLADLLETEAVLITSGAASGLTLSAAACMTGHDQKKVSQLPDTSGMNDEIIVMRNHRNPYDQAIRIAGAEFREVGNAIETSRLDLEAAINDNTAAIFYFEQSSLFRASLGLEEIIKTGKKYEIPVVVDAAAELPPKENLFKFTDMGADIVLFSGGKDLRGPQSSGLMLGKKDIIEVCKLHNYPNHAIGRPMKVDKETIMGLVRAVELYLEEDHKSRMEWWADKSLEIASSIDNYEIFDISVAESTQPLTQPSIIPRVFIKINSDNFKMPSLSKGEILKKIEQKLYQGENPVIVVRDKEAVIINPHMLKKGETEIVATKVNEILEELVNKNNLLN